MGLFAGCARQISCVVMGVMTLTRASLGVPAPESMSHERAGFVAVTDDTGKIYAISGEVDDSAPASMERLDPSTGKWETVPAPPRKRYDAAAVFTSGKIHLIGGEQDSSASERYAEDIVAFDVVAAQWSRSGKLAGARAGLGAAAIGNEIYTAGGRAVRHSSPAPAVIPDGQANYLDAYGVRLLEKLVLGEGSSVLRPMPRRRTAHGLVASGNKIYAVGGMFTGDFHGYPDHLSEFGAGYLNKTVEAYDPAQNQWTLVGEMKTPRQGLAAVTASDGRIYTFGGADARVSPKVTGVVEVLDPATGTWESRAAMPTARTRHAAVLGKDGKFYVMGGYDKHGRPSAIVEVYDPSSDTWQTSATPGNPIDEQDLESLEAKFEGTDTTLPNAETLRNWFTGRCYEHGAPSIPVGGLLAGTTTEEGLLLGLLQTTRTENRKWFDELTSGKRQEARETLAANNKNVRPARVEGKALVSLIVRKGTFTTRTYELQVTETPQWYLARLVDLDHEGTPTLAMCLLRKQPSSR